MMDDYKKLYHALCLHDDEDKDDDKDDERLFGTKALTK